ncbi:MAG: single-stranded DNA-binding protein [Candidatus Omnitrophota bacterium]|jgi:single-strand DNA-binding protein
MANYNKVILMGNLTRDPELRYIPSGTAVVNLRLAVNRRFRDRSGEQRDEVCFVTVVAWDKQAELCNQYLQKGRPVFVEGRLQSRTFEDSSGNKRNVIEVRAERIQFLGTRAAPAVSTKDVSIDQAGIPESTSEDSWLGATETEGEVNASGEDKV